MQHLGQTTSKSPNVRIMLGVPDGVVAAGSGWSVAPGVGDIIEYAKQFRSFRGVMACGESRVDGSSGFAPGVRASL